MDRMKRSDKSTECVRKTKSKSRARLAALAAAILMVSRIATVPCSGQDNSDVRTPGHIPIMTWPGPDASLLTPETFRLIAEAGFSVNMSSLGGRKANLKALDLARAAGLRLMVQDDRVSKLVEDASLPLDILADVVADYKLSLIHI